jgi:hypothetical protein
LGPMSGAEEVRPIGRFAVKDHLQKIAGVRVQGCRFMLPEVLSSAPAERVALDRLP